MENQEDVTCKLKCEENNISGKNSAYLAMFSCGLMTKKSPKNLKFQSYENSLTPDGLERKRTRKILVAESGKLQYSGFSYGTEASQRAELCKYFVGVRNKKTGIMTVHEIQLVHCLPHLNITSHEDDEDFNRAQSYADKNDMLTDAFGSKRKRQAMVNRMAYAKGDTDGSNVADSVDVADLRKTDPDANEVPDSLMAKVIPPRDLSATMPDKVYDIKDIISAEEYYALEPIAKTLSEATSEQVQQWKTDSTYGELILQNLQNSRSSVDINKAKLLIYYNYLTQVLKLVAKEARKKDPIPDVPEPFKRKVLERFTLSSSNERGALVRTMPQSLKDKAMIYAMILALFIEDFRVELPVLQNDFKKGQPTLVKIANALGCHVVSQKKSGVAIKIAELRLPLFVAVPKTFGKKR